MRIVISLAVYFIFVYLGSDILEWLGLNLGDDYGISQLTGKINISISGAIVSSIIGFIAAAALIILDEDEIGFIIAIFFWLYQIYGDYSEMTKFIGWIGFFLLTLDNIIMLATLVAANSIKDKLRRFFRNLKRNSNDLPPPEL